MKAGDVMTGAIISATGDTPVRYIVQLLLQNHISAIPVSMSELYRKLAMRPGSNAPRPVLR